ncbi:carbohydrate-binding protein [Bacillus cereus]|uniref:carbohydrate-binding protein n=1 Tax=Bacillus cereus TaxID=1396 RepID=UPI0028529516|nr:carbohydrate-binding protein [Bacillus cereus]WLE90982.1 hypothetical protein GGBNIMDK_00013 [Bacillus cereus]WLE91174.1 hypothetical protein GGBNIMDK_00205 [Bacillus cereus]
MKNKKKQLIKGIMLSTVLGLGWGVTVDISHAAGNEFFQIEEAPEWSSEKEYVKGDIVTYNGVRYLARFDKPAAWGGYYIPNRSFFWKVLDAPEWSREKSYMLDDIITYKGNKYRARGLMSWSSHPAVNWKSLETIEWSSHPAISVNWQSLDALEWSSEKRYNKYDIVTYKGVEYSATGLTLDDEPNKSMMWEVNTH